jgi:hypothetical protein
MSLLDIRTTIAGVSQALREHDLPINPSLDCRTDDVTARGRLSPAATFLLNLRMVSKSYLRLVKWWLMARFRSG